MEKNKYRIDIVTSVAAKSVTLYGGAENREVIYSGRHKMQTLFW